jgi:hypothetical protein
VVYFWGMANNDFAAKLREDRTAALRERMPSSLGVYEPSQPANNNNFPDPVAELIKNKQLARASRREGSEETSNEDSEENTISDEFQNTMITVFKIGSTIPSMFGIDLGFFATAVGGSSTAGLIRGLIENDESEANSDKKTKIIKDFFLPKVGLSKGKLGNTIVLLWIPIAIAIGIFSLIIAVTMMYNWFTDNTWLGWALSWAPGWADSWVLWAAGY